jgi:hypothetical protein
MPKRMRRIFPILFVILSRFISAQGAEPGGNPVVCEQFAGDRKSPDVGTLAPSTGIPIRNPRAIAYCLSNIPSIAPNLAASSRPNDPNPTGFYMSGNVLFYLSVDLRTPSAIKVFQPNSSGAFAATAICSTPPQSFGSPANLHRHRVCGNRQINLSGHRHGWV